MEVHEKGKLLERAVKDGDGIVNMDKLVFFVVALFIVTFRRIFELGECSHFFIL